MAENTLSSKYNPQEVEAGRYQEWLEKDLFKPSGDKKAKPYSIVIPPPNVTGKLHLGHAWDTTLQDMIIRQKRMQGYDTLWLPGMDHAGIATQAKVEAKLQEQGISRYDLGREKFVEQVWDWKEEYATHIREQWGKLGISVDYSRERFTLDEGLSKAVRKVFVSLYEKGLIYRGEYIINWDPKARTALSDIEVIHKDVEGAFYHMTYELADGSGAVEIATTRPETMLGDTAVAVHPDDERYQHLIGKNVILPIVNKEIPVVADTYVDMEFGTGVVKITPAHDPNDFEVGNRHDLPRVNVMNEDGTMNELAGKYAGMDRFEARKAIVKELEELGRLVKIEKMVHSVGHSERTGVVVEPRLSTQWFVKMAPLAKRAIENQETEDAVEFYPPRFNQTFLRWMENVHDWVISRQLWWGHQIPAWYHKETGEMYVGMQAPEDSENWVQDSDVLDTWFSSALWPFSTMGWPDTENEDFKRYFPTNTLVTGYDIIFFWVSRMIFQSLEFTDSRPFKNVLIHGLIRDEQGRKMSKSLGNTIVPETVIKQMGADILRLWVSSVDYESDVRVSMDILAQVSEVYRKIRNTMRFLLANTTDFDPKADRVAYEDLRSVDKYMMVRLNQTIEQIRKEGYDKYNFLHIYRTVVNFLTVDLSSFYLDFAKDVVYIEAADNHERRCMQTVFYDIAVALTKLLTPIIPHTAEEIWGYLKEEEEYVQLAEFPEVETFANQEELLDMWKAFMDFRDDVLKALEVARNEKLIGKSMEAKVTVYPNEQVRALLTALNANLPQLLIISPDFFTVSEEGPASAPEAAQKFEDVAILVERAEGHVCDRCRQVKAKLSDHEHLEHVCEHCAEVIESEFPEEAKVGFE